MYRSRVLDLTSPTQTKSCFLFGPRQTGKSTLVEHTFPNAVQIDLLDDDIFLRLSQNAKNLGSYIPNSKALVIIDEIQRIPGLLNEVHRLIEKQKIRFVLTGSSARKLRTKGVNLLGGRARSRVLHPFVYPEIKNQFDLKRALTLGSIPSIYLSDSPQDDLKSYVGDYLKQEIIAEAATRNIPAFSRFLEVAAVSNGQMLNYEKIAQDAQVPRSTVQSYYQILRDTLIGQDLPAYRKTTIRKAVGTQKFYFFDLGVVNTLRRVRSVEANTSDFGQVFEAYIHHELSSYVDYHPGSELNYWRSKSGFEVDFLLNGEIGIEVKSTRAVNPSDLKGLLALSEDLKLKRRVIVCQEPRPRILGGVELIPWELFLQELWS